MQSLTIPREFCSYYRMRLLKPWAADVRNSAVSCGNPKHRIAGAWVTDENCLFTENLHLPDGEFSNTIFFVLHFKIPLRKIALGKLRAAPEMTLCCSMLSSSEALCENASCYRYSVWSHHGSFSYPRVTNILS